MSRDHPSLADQAVSVLAMVSKIGDGLGTDDPERHVVWGLKRAAEYILQEAFKTAELLAYRAKDVRDLVEDLTPEVPDADPTHPTTGD